MFRFSQCRPRRNPGLFLLLIGLLPAAALAQQTDTAVVPLGEIVAQGRRPVATTGGASALEVRLDSLRLLAAPTLDQVLRRLPLVQVRTNSRGESQFSLRGSGSDARQVAVIVDGIPLNFGWDDRADLSVLPTSAAQSLTVARGLPSLLYGPNILGGVVEIGVARGLHDAVEPGKRVDAGVDHTGAFGLGAAITRPVRAGRGGWLLRAGAGHRERDGFALPATVTEPVPAADHDLRLNTDYRHTDGFAAASYRADGGAWADASVSAFRAERGIAAELHVDNARFWRYPELWRTFGVVAGGTGARVSPFGGTGDVELSLGADMGHTQIDQYRDRSYQTVSAKESSDDRNLTLRLRADQSLAGNAELRAGLTYADIRHNELLTPGGGATYRQRLWSSALEAIAPLGARTRVAAGFAIDGADTPESADKPPLGRLSDWGARAGITTAPSARLLVHAGVSRRARFPSLRELYSGALGRFEPNPDLAPELLVAFEAGAGVTHARAQLQIVAFHHVLSDAIVRTTTSTGKFQRVNRDRQTGTGIELLGGARTGVLLWSGDLVLQRTRLQEGASGEEMEAEYQPAVIAGAGVTGPLPWQLRFDAATRYTGAQSCIAPDGSMQDIAANLRVDGEISRQWRRRGTSIEIAAGADNLTDALAYDQCGLPQPGRTLRLQLRLR